MIICNIDSEKKEISIFKDNYLAESKCFDELDYKKESNEDIKICNILKLMNKSSIYLKAVYNSKEEDTKFVIDNKKLYDLLKPNNTLINKLSNSMKKNIKNNELKILLGSVLFELHNIKNIDIELYVDDDAKGDDDIMFGNTSITGNGMSLKNFKPMKINTNENFDLNKENNNEYSLGASNDNQRESLKLEDNFSLDINDDDFGSSNDFTFDLNEGSLNLNNHEEKLNEDNQSLSLDVEDISKKDEFNLNSEFNLESKLDDNEFNLESNKLSDEFNLNSEDKSFDNNFSLSNLIGGKSKVIKKNPSTVTSNPMENLLNNEPIISDEPIIAEDSLSKYDNKALETTTLNEDYKLEEVEIKENVMTNDNNKLATTEKNISTLSFDEEKTNNDLETQLTKELSNMEKYIGEQLESLNSQYKKIENNSDLSIDLSNLDISDEELIEKFNKAMEMRLRLKVIKKSCKIYTNLKNQLQGDLSKF